MNMFCVAGVTPTETITPEQERAFRDATVVFVGAILSVIGAKLVDAYLHVRVAKDLWEALESKFSATDAGSEMYTIEQFHDYKMVETVLYWSRLMRYNASQKSLSFSSVMYQENLSRDALSLSCLIHGGALALL